MKTIVTFVQGLGLAAAMCALASGYIAFTTHRPALLVYLDHDHLPQSLLAAGGVCLVFALVWTLLNGRRIRA